MNAEPDAATIDALAAEVLERCRQSRLRVATAESCTGGLIAGALTAIAGASDVIGRGYVAYSNAAKTSMLGVPTEVLEAHGAVSEATVRAMTAGALKASGDDADIAVAATGFAGPGGGGPEKPVGTVWLAVERRGEPVIVERCELDGERTSVRQQAVVRALALVRDVAVS